jgi:hypothetical protein
MDLVQEEGLRQSREGGSILLPVSSGGICLPWPDRPGNPRIGVLQTPAPATRTLATFGHISRKGPRLSTATPSRRAFLPLTALSQRFPSTVRILS